MSENEDDRIPALHAAYARTRDSRLRDQLLAHYDAFALRLARGFRSRREERDDLIQVARIGLIHAVDRFDPDRQRPFTAFARVTILGEMKRHVRDHTGRIRLSRTLHERWAVIAWAVDDLTQELRRLPLVGEIAARTRLTEEQVFEATGFAGVMPVGSIESGLAGESLRGGTDDEFRLVENRQTAVSLVALLPEPARNVVRLRFGGELTQAQIANRLGMSQMAVSRSLARSCGRMRVSLAR